MRALVFVAAAVALLSACKKREPESVEARAANASIHLEQRYKELQAEAENDAATDAAPVENDADALLSQMNGAAPAGNAAEGNSR
jgi:hypothetical protein